MPPSARKGKTRARKAPAAEPTHEPSDVDVAEAQATPTRGSKKRTRGGETTATAARNTRRKTKDTRVAEREETEGTEVQEASDNETEPSSPTEQEIIQSLRVSDKQVMAVSDFANDLLEGEENVPGYGKIAGRDWVYIIRKVEINIGRPETHERPSGVVPDGTPSQPTTPTAKTNIDIDLGPDRQISRLHCVIHYEPAEQRWILRVNGRNAIRIDNHLVRRGDAYALRNGSVIEIGGTQMAFITTAMDENDGPVWDASIIRQAQSSSEDGQDGEDDPRNGMGRAQPSSASRGHLQDQGMYQSDHNGHQHQQQSSQQQRMHPHSHRATLQANPGTPMRASQSYAKSSPAGNYARGVMMESTETIDYAADNARDLKPPHSYAQLIGMAILSTHDQQMTLANIYKWIQANYAFYRFNTGGWQNSIRHNLSLNKAFTKIARRTDEPGKGMKWMIEPTEFDNFVAQGMKGCRRPNPIPGTQSTLGSPNSPALRTGIKRDDDITPPMNTYQPSYSTAIEAYTPDRGPRRPANGRLESSVGLGIEGNSLVDYDYPHRSTPRNGLNALAHAAGSPPALYVNDEGRTGPLDTPFPLRPSQRLAPPSTLRRPSDFIQFSSPAPFWKMEGLAGSTPFKPFDISPLKTPFPLQKEAVKQSKESEEQTSPVEKSEADEEQSTSTELKRGGSPLIGSSSPPRPLNSVRALDASPTLSRPTTAITKTLSQHSTSTQEHTDVQHAPEKTPPSALSHASVVQQHTPPTTVVQPAHPIARQHELPKAAVVNNFEAARPIANGAYNLQASSYAGVQQANAYQSADDDDEGIDLAKGFQPIGSFHQQNHMHMHRGVAGASSFGA